MKNLKQATLLISCADQSGIVARFSQILFGANANILTLEEHTEQDWFFMRIHFDCDQQTVTFKKLTDELNKLASELSAKLQIFEDGYVPRVAILASKEIACPQELLSRHKAGELVCDIPLMISNHDNMAELADMYKVEFRHVSFDEDRVRAEKQIIDILKSARIDLVVLARFMMILSPDFVNEFSDRIINIHHGFLPAFKGARPYLQAFEKGVKVIGATSHFVTADLDEGPIIAQEVIPVTHQYSVKDMVKAGQDAERKALLKATASYVDHKLILHDNRTVVFR